MIQTNVRSNQYESLKGLNNTLISLKNEDQRISEISTFCKHLDIEGILNYMLYSLVSEKYYAPFNSVHNKLTLYTSKAYDFSVVHNPPKDTDRKEQYVYSYTNDVFLCPLLDIPNSKYQIYEQNSTVQPEVFDKSAKLTLRKEATFYKNKAIYLQKFKDILKLDESRPFLMLMISSKESFCSYTWEYDVNTLQPNRIVLADINIARLGTTAKILGSIGDANSVPLLKKLCGHHSHTVRWDAVRSLIQINFEEGIKGLKQMTKDDHHEVRTAAVNSLGLLNLKTT